MLKLLIRRKIAEEVTIDSNNLQTPSTVFNLYGHQKKVHYSRSASGKADTRITTEAAIQQGNTCFIIVIKVSIPNTLGAYFESFLSYPFLLDRMEEYLLL